MKRGRKNVLPAQGRTHRWTKAPAIFLGAALLASLGASACGAVDPSAEDGDWAELSQAAVTPVTVSFQNGVLPTSAYAGNTDATIRQAATTTNYGSATSCEADGDDGSGVDKSCLLRWTVSGIPAGSTVQSASVSLRVVDGPRTRTASTSSRRAGTRHRSWAKGDHFPELEHGRRARRHGSRRPDRQHHRQRRRGRHHAQRGWYRRRAAVGRRHLEPGSRRRARHQHEWH